MGSPFSDMVELVSFHSASKVFMGEEVVELVNMDPLVMEKFCMLISPLAATILTLDRKKDACSGNNYLDSCVADLAQEVVAQEVLAQEVERVLNRKIAGLIQYKEGPPCSPDYTFNKPRFCIMNSMDTMEEVLRRLSTFHKQFMKDFS
ncbi:Alanine aminotransferase 2 [Merluccius polli]|uniref:Alanine aminotransferase 2 n=1 Tax=Merluccius polli TaxID=89951 RepID=A0AA47N2S6_MERPO|nr:Alanine aminotransferase 2 [Merluccius polli]